MIEGSCNSWHKIPVVLPGSPVATYRYMGKYYFGSAEVLRDAYLTVECHNPMYSDVILYDGDDLKTFTPFFNTGNLGIFSMTEINVICYVYSRAIKRNFFNADDSTRKLFGLVGNFDMQLKDYIDYIRNKRRGIEPGGNTPIPFLLTNAQCLMVRAIA